MTGADVVIENFKPGTMERWGLGPEAFEASNPELIYARISGYGQTGPYAKKPGFASVTEAFSGFRHLNGFPGEAPVRPNLSIGDTVAGLHAALGILLALLERSQGQQGQVVDVALYEAMYNLMEGVVPEYSGTGAVRGASGTTITGIVPTNTYRCSDGKFVVIGGNGDSIFVRLMRAMGRDDLADNPAYAHNTGRVTHEAVLDSAIADWTASRSAEDVVSTLEAADVPVGLIYDVADMFEDPQYQARGMFEEVTVGKRKLSIPAIVPKLARTPGFTEWPGPEVAEHRDQVLREVGYSDAEIAALSAGGDI
jgi:crotonobetainyl-CoA:carnitine CoA-transferase CaiB-like acyl-CoA transferase